MRFNGCFFIIFFSAFFSLLVFSAHGVGQTAKQNVADTQFSIKPLTCIVKKLGDVCAMTVKLQWRTKQVVNACLYQDQTKLTCWLNKNHINTMIEIKVKANTEFFLMTNNNEILANQKVMINASSPKKYRRRLRAQWSLF